MNLLDSSGWLEYFADGAGADNFVQALKDIDRLIVPSVCLYEVFKIVLRERNENDALQAIALMQQGKVIEMDSQIAIQAAKISIDYKLPMADSIILATSQAYDATIWTQDADFKDIPGVKYFQKS